MTIKDIRFCVDNSFQGDAIATGVQFDGMALIRLMIGHAGSRSKAGNLNFNTFINAVLTCCKRRSNFQLKC